MTITFVKEVNVSFDSIQEIFEFYPEEVAKSIVDVLMLAGGFCSCIVTEEQINVCRSLGDEKSQVGPTVCVLVDIADRLSEEEFHAVLLHEMAHILNGDLENQDINKIKNGILVNQDFELAADAFAAKHINKEAMRSALLSIFKSRQDLMLKHKHSDVIYYYDLCISDTMVRRRLEALS